MERLTLEQKLANFQPGVFCPFDDLTKDEIKDLSSHIKWREAGEVIAYLGAEKLKAHLPSFLEMLQDRNWPAAGKVSDMFVRSPEIVADTIADFLWQTKNDDQWTANVLSGVIASWSPDITNNFTDHLIRISSEGFESSIAAIVILKNHQLLSKNELQEVYEHAKTRFESHENAYWKNCLDEGFNS